MFNITVPAGFSFHPKSANKLLYLSPVKIVITAGVPFAGRAFKVPELCAANLARTVLRRRKLARWAIVRNRNEISR
jgi:hypothetical protein